MGHNDVDCTSRALARHSQLRAVHQPRNNRKCLVTSLYLNQVSFNRAFYTVTSTPKLTCTAIASSFAKAAAYSAADVGAGVTFRCRQKIVTENNDVN